MFVLISVKMDLERNGMFFRFEPERSISSYEEFYQAVVMKLILRIEIYLPGKIATLVFGESVKIASR